MIDLIIPTLILATIAIIVAIAALVIVLAMKFSTHQIEWKPVPMNGTDIDDPFAAKDIDALSDNEEEELDKALKLQKSKKKEKKDEDPLDEILQSNNF